jgi:glycosyltransferase involved in cell wall biosynthesis
VVLAHDVRLAQLYAFAAYHGVLPGGFGDAVLRIYGRRGYPALLPVAEAASVDLLMARELIRSSKAFLTTSEFAAALAREEGDFGSGQRIGVLPFAHRLVPERPDPGPDALPLVASFGVVNRSKATATLLEAFALVAAKEPLARLAVVGPASSTDLEELKAAARRLGVAGRAVFTGQVDDRTWDRWLSEASVAVQLRSFTNGEYSAAVAECFSFGVPTIVTDLGSMRELPEDTVVKVPPDCDPAALAAEILALIGDPARREALGKEARAHAAAHSFARVAEELFGVLRDE